MGGTGVVSRRLSKPRKNNSSSNLLSWSDTPVEMPSSPLTSSDMDYNFGEQTTNVSSQGERRSRRKSRSKLRAYLYGSSPQDSSPSWSSDEEEEEQRHNSLVDAARGAKKRLSRTGSSIMQLSSAKASTNYLSSASTPNLQSSDQAESIIVAEQIKEKARLDRIAAENHISSPVDEEKHVDSVMAPLRRRSLFTPGIATRQSSDILRKPPPPQSVVSQADRDYYYNPSKPINSPLATLAAMSHVENGRSTPIQDVSHLGELQLGTLRITNGMDSPSSIDSRSICHRRSFSLESSQEFQTASEGSDHEGRVTPTDLQRNLTIKASPIKPNLARPTNQIITNTRTIVQQPPQKRTSFPFQQESSDLAPTLAQEYVSEFDVSPFSYSETPLSKEWSRFSNTDLDEGIVLPCSQEANEQAPEMRSLRSMIDKAEPADNRNGTREEAFSKLNGSTNNSKVESYSNSTHGSDSGYSSKTSSNSGPHEYNTLETSQGTRLQRRTLTPRIVSGQREMAEVRSKKEVKDTNLEPPPQVRPSFTVIPRHALAESESRMASTGTLETVNSVRPSARSPSQVLVKKLQKIRPKSLPPPPVNTITVQGYRELEHVHIPRVPSVIAARHAERLTRFPLLEHTFPSSDHVSASRTSTLTQVHNVPIRFPSPANALTAGKVGVAHTKTQPEILVTPTQTTDDEWGQASLVRSPSWSAYGSGKQKKLEKKAAKDRREAEKKQAKEEKEQEKKLAKDRKETEKQLRRDRSQETTHRSRRSSWGRAKSSERRSSEVDAQPAIADFGTVTESLGASPYDAARLTQSTKDSSLQQRNWHPHQIGTSMPQTRPFNRMDTNRVSGSSTVRGRPRSQSIDRPGTPANGMLAEENVEGSRTPSRPQTMYAEVPPVPSLSAVDLKHHNLEWARHNQRNRSGFKDLEETNSRRPQSMGVAGLNTRASPDRAQLRKEETQYRPQSMAINSNVEEYEAPRRSNDRPRFGQSASPPKSKLSNALPDVWTSGSLERRGPAEAESLMRSTEMDSSAVADELVDPNENIWEGQQRAWSERRRSAGEALFLQNQMKDNFDSKDPRIVPISEQKPRPQSSIPKSTTTDFSGLDYNPKTRRPTASPLVSQPVNSAPMPRIRVNTDQNLPREPRGQRIPSLPTPAERRAQGRPQSIPRKRVGSGPSSRSTSQNRSSVVPSQEVPPVPRSTVIDSSADSPKSFQRLSGRYDGGLLYGYEPGQGLGGSAGTRGAKTMASRKSVEVSKGFGLDLSDVPVFVAPAMH